MEGVACLGTRCFEIPDDIVVGVEDVEDGKKFSYGKLKLKIDLLGAVAGKYYFVELLIPSSLLTPMFYLYHTADREVSTAEIPLISVLLPELGLNTKDIRESELERLWYQKHYTPIEDLESLRYYKEIVANIERRGRG